MDLEDLYRLLRTGHVQSQGVVDTLDDPLLVLDQSYNVLSGNLSFFETFKVTKDATIGHPLFSLGSGQWDIPALRTLLAEVVPRSTAIIGYEVTHDFPAVGVRTMLVSARRMVHPDSNSTCMLLVFEDITKQRRAEAQKDMLLSEGRHRMGNLLGTVLAIATQTGVEGRSAIEYRDAFLYRFKALMDAQDFWLSGRSTADFAEIVQEVAKLADSAFICQGPSVSLPASQVVPLSLVLHELTTNALKYGALSAQGGIVHVNWSVAADAGAAPALMIEWREENGPAVTPPTRFGFGSKLIEFSVKRELEGTAHLHFDPEGFRCSISMPIGEILAERGIGAFVTATGVERGGD